MSFNIFYLEDARVSFASFFIPFLQLLFFLTGTFIGVSRYMDHHHHVEDVFVFFITLKILTGMLLGYLISFLVKKYLVNPFTKEERFLQFVSLFGPKEKVEDVREEINVEKEVYDSKFI
jgi:Na+-driven multidrug efflux pump